MDEDYVDGAIAGTNEISPDVAEVEVSVSVLNAGEMLQTFAASHTFDCGVTDMSPKHKKLAAVREKANGVLARFKGALAA